MRSNYSTVNVCSITVTFNPDLKVIERQIDSLTEEVNKIIIVDNGSRNFDDLSRFVIKKNNALQEKIILLHNELNMGLGFAQNLGIKIAIEQKVDEILLLDHDTILEKSFIYKLLQSKYTLINKGVKLAAVGPTYYSEIDNKPYPITKFKGPFIERIVPLSEPVEASFIIASGSLISLKVLEKVGLMNEEYFIDCIDVEWCFRAKALGYKVYASPSARMAHSIGDRRISIFGRTISVHSPLRRYYLYRNSIFMVKNKNTPLGYKVRESALNLFRLTIFLFLSADRLQYLRYSFKGFHDGIKGIVGKCPYNY